MNQELHFLLLYSIILLLLIYIVVSKIDDFTGGLIKKSVEVLPRVFPYVFRVFPWASKKWLCTWHKHVVARTVRNVAGSAFDACMDLEFVHADTARVERQGKKLLVMLDPTKNKEENFVNLVLAVAENCVPHSKTILTPKLRSCVRLSFAQELLESQGRNLRIREFAHNHLMKGNTNILSSNPYYPQLLPIKEKKLLGRVYMHSLASFAEHFDPAASPVDLKKTADKFTERLADIAKGFMDTNVPDLIQKADPTFEDGFEFFFRENGLSVNLMLVRSNSTFQTGDVNPYVDKANDLVTRGVNVNYVICGGFNTRNMQKREHRKRITFTKKVALAISRHVRQFDLVSEGEQTLIISNIEFPVYAAVFVRNPKYV